MSKTCFAVYKRQIRHLMVTGCLCRSERLNNVHYPTEVVGGMIEGAAWLNIVGMVTNRHRLA